MRVQKSASGIGYVGASAVGPKGKRMRGVTVRLEEKQIKHLDSREIERSQYVRMLVDKDMENEK